MPSELNSSTKLPLRWKIFQLVNFIQAFISIGFILLFLAYLIGTLNTDGLIWLILFVLLFASIAVNNFFNIHLLNKYFPDKALPPSKEKAVTGLFIFYLLITIAFCFLGIAGLIFELREIETGASQLLLGIFAFNSLLGLYILIEQATLPGLIDRNNKKEMRRITEEIGSW